MKIKKTNSVPKISPDWFVRGILSRIGENFDRLTGRNWKPSSSLATSELIEKIKALLDAEIKDLGAEGKFVPHNIKLKMQWDKFSTDSDEAIELLANELHVAAIDHINDKRYYTFAPINIDIKPDYFTEGVKLLASFETFDEEEREAAVNVTLPELKSKELISEIDQPEELEKEEIVVEFVLNGKPKEVKLKFGLGDRKSVGRTKENDLTINDPSISKVHAAFVFNSQSQLMLADTGSTNGTFINGQRIAYGRAFPVSENDILRFGAVELSLKHIPGVQPDTEPEIPADFAAEESDRLPESISVDDFTESTEAVSRPISEQNYSDSTNFSTEPVEKELVEPTQPGIVLDFGEADKEEEK